MSKKNCFLIGLFIFLFPLLYPGIYLLQMDGLPGGDLPLYHLPHQEFIRENLVEGIIPFWNPYVFGGSPEFDNPEMTPMYWTNGPLLLLFGAEMMLKLKYLLHLGLLGLGAFLLFRRLSVGTWLAAAGAMTLQISGFAITKIALPNVGDSAVWLPMILFLTLWMRSQWTLGRALVYTLICGMMTQLFFPQITLTIVMLAAIVSGFYYFKFNSTDTSESKQRKIIHRVLLPLAEGLVLVCLLRYPSRHIPFPEPGWRNAFGGFGIIGLSALIGAMAMWVYWFFALKIRFRIQWGGLFKWAGLFCLLWLFAAGFAAPQLALTAEMIPQSNQSALVYTDNDFFTGAQAYGSAREFIQQSALAAPKESVNNMALGPLPWGLAVLGLLLGLHRRHRLFLIFSIFTALIFTIYMAGPAVFDVFRRLPFFKSFAGLSRYLAFLNFFLVAMAVLCAALCLRWARGVMRPVLIFCLVFGFLLNTAMLVRHEHNYWQKLMENKTELNFGELVEFVKANKSPGGRILVDARDESLRSHSMIFPLAARIPGVQDSNDPMHTQRYGRWLAAHNDLFGVDYSDYRSSRFFPSPSPYLRALGVRDYLYPPGSKIPAVVLGELQETGRYAGWRLMRDREPWPVAWPISDTSKLQTFPDLPEGWDVIKDLDEGTGNTWHMTIDNPGLATIVVISKPWYPGWTAKSDKMQTIPVGRAYGFLQSVPVEHGLQTISFHYQPYSFVLGWLLFICFSGAYSVILFQWVFLKSRVLLRHDLLFCLLPGLITCALRISTITGSPDRFFHRAFDLIIVCASAVILVFIIHLYKKRRVNPKTN